MLVFAVSLLVFYIQPDHVAGFGVRPVPASNLSGFGRRARAKIPRSYLGVSWYTVIIPTNCLYQSGLVTTICWVTCLLACLICLLIYLFIYWLVGQLRDCSTVCLLAWLLAWLKLAWFISWFLAWLSLLIELAVQLCHFWGISSFRFGLVWAITTTPTTWMPAAGLHFIQPHLLRFASAFFQFGKVSF